MKDVTDKLLVEGVQLFSDAFEKLLKAVEKQTQRRRGGKAQSPDVHAARAARRCGERRRWRSGAHQGKVRKLWARDASLWTGKDEAQWLGWLGITNDQLAHIERLSAIREAARSAGFSHVLLLGMGGSSLGPEVIKTTFGTISGLPGTPRARFDRSSSGEDLREQSRSEEHAVHRLEQVRLDARA